MEFNLKLIEELVPSPIFHISIPKISQQKHFETSFMRVDSSSIVQILPSPKNKKHLYVMEVVNNMVRSIMWFKASKKNVSEALDFQRRGGKFTLNYNCDENRFFLSTKNVAQPDLDQYMDPDEIDKMFGVFSSSDYC